MDNVYLLYLYIYYFICIINIRFWIIIEINIYVFINDGKGARIRDIGTGCHVRLHVRSRNVHRPKKIGQIIGFST